jgi:hypothetical protein
MIYVTRAVIPHPRTEQREQANKPKQVQWRAAHDRIFLIHHM